jgi:hypothetical protein
MMPRLADGGIIPPDIDANVGAAALQHVLLAVGVGAVLGMSVMQAPQISFVVQAVLRV